MSQSEIICIGCPTGCRVMLKTNPDGHIESITGNRCKEGIKYVTAEFQNPVRIFTSTVQTEGGQRLLPVKTDKPIHKSQLKELAYTVARIKVRLPVATGQEIVHDILGTGANLVSTGALSESMRR